MTSKADELAARFPDDADVQAVIAELCALRDTLRPIALDPAAFDTIGDITLRAYNAWVELYGEEA